MPRNAYWTCTRVTAGVRCGAKNPRRARKCAVCGKTRPVKRRAAHLAALELPYAHYLALNGGLERCGICGAEPGARRLHRDHGHTAGGHPRGLLCFRCNSALRGYMTVEWLQGALDYLERAGRRAA